MGSTCCKGNDPQQTQLGQVVKIDNKETKFFELFPKIEKTVDKLRKEGDIPSNWSINPDLQTLIKDQGFFLGKRNAKVRAGYGIMLYDKGFYYIGGWHNNCRQGMGLMIDNKGDFYKGEWFCDEPNGYGEYHDLENNWVYKGKWKNGKKEGKGEETFPNGVRYVGNFSNDLKNGPGTLIFDAVCKFAGHFQNDVIQKHGLQRGQNYLYDGPWLNGEMHGPGRCVYYKEKPKTKSGDKDEKEDEYIGQFVNGLKHGYGQYHWADGTKYKGLWEEGQIANKGVFIVNN